MLFDLARLSRVHLTMSLQEYRRYMGSVYNVLVGKPDINRRQLRKSTENSIQDALLLQLNSG